MSKCSKQRVSLLGHGVSGDVDHGVRHGQDLVGLGVGDLDAELLRIQSKKEVRKEGGKEGEWQVHGANTSERVATTATGR